MTAIAELADVILDLTDEELAEFALSLDDDELAALEEAVADPALAAYATSRSYLGDPGGWVATRLREHLWSIQVKIAESVTRNRFTCVPSCHGAGKSFVAARIVCWWLETHPPGDAFVVTTAPTGDQVRGILWREINRAHSKGKLIGRVNLSQWYIGNELVAIGRKPADTNPAAFQGLHARFILVVIDEADGVADAIFDAASDTLATNENARVLAIGNPDRGAGPFFKAQQPGSEWNIIRISAFDTPNFTGELVPARVAEVLVDQTWVAERQRKWGEDDPRYQSKVLAQPPADNPHGVIPWSALRESMRPRDWTPAELASVEGGLDVAAGGDRTVVWLRQGRRLWKHLTFREADPERAEGLIVPFLAANGVTRLKVDVIGVGWAFAGMLNKARREGKHDARIERVNVGNTGSVPSSTSPGFPKLRDQLWWDVGRVNSMGGDDAEAAGPLWDLSVLDDADEYDEVVQELITPTWTPDSQGRIKVEPKAETIKKIGRSPDDADAILLAFYSPRTQGRASGRSVARARI